MDGERVGVVVGGGVGRMARGAERGLRGGGGGRAALRGRHRLLHVVCRYLSGALSHVESWQ